MILNALVGYYERAEDLPREGWVRRGVDYVVVLDPQGECVNIEAHGEQEGGKMVGRNMLLPAIGKQGMKHNNSGKDANLLWDNASFVLGKGKKGDIKLSSFIATLDQWLGNIEDVGLRAVKRFCTNLQSGIGVTEALIERFQLRDDFDKRDPVLIFRLVSDIEAVHFRVAVRGAYESAFTSEKRTIKVRGTCLVTGNEDVPIAENESVLKGIWGGQPAGCNIVSFNAPAFESYGKRERNGENAPIGLYASFAYTTALNHLLASNQRVQVGDASAVFWAERPNSLETLGPDLFGDPPKDDPDRGSDALRALYTAVQSGRFAVGDARDRFHVLGLAPNAARISVRFWETAPAAVLGRRILEHFTDLRIVRSGNEREYLSLKQLLVACAPPGKVDNVPPRLSGDLIWAALTGAPYPRLLLVSCLNRSFGEQARKEPKTGKHVNHVPYPRAAILKAWLNRQSRANHQTQEITVSLDITSNNVPYRLGRLFAVLEKIQQDAHPRINTTIRDSFFGAACSSPAKVFPSLIRKSQHHMTSLRKQKPGLYIIRDGLIAEIMSDGLDGDRGFPNFLCMEDQGRFVVGYYQQRQALFDKG